MTTQSNPTPHRNQDNGRRGTNLTRQVWALVLLLTMGISWGLSFSLAKIAAVGGAHPFGITFWQTLVGAAVLFAILLARRQMLVWNPASIRFYMVCGLLGAAIPGILFYYAAAHLPAGVLSISVATIPILTFVLSAVFRLEPFTQLRGLGVVCGATAIVILVGPQQSLPGPELTHWVLVACLAAASYAAWNLVIALNRDSQQTALAITCGMYVSATVLMAPVLLATDSFVSLAWPFGAVEWAIVGMGVISAVAYSLFIYLVGLSGPVFASQASYIVTVSGVFWGMVLFGERHSSWIWLSLTVMCVGLMLVLPRRQYVAKQGDDPAAD